MDVLQKKLAQEGYEVAVAEDGEEGLRKIKEVKPDLILLDIIMPKKDGFEVLEEINKNKELGSIPVIIISNSGQAVEIDRALKMGVKDYLIKTEFDPDEVVKKVAKVFGAEPAVSKKSGYSESMGESKKINSVNGTKILIVEDDKFLRDLIVRKIKDEGYEVDYAIEGEEALKKIKEGIPSLVLLDLILPGIDGFEVLKQMRDDTSGKIKKIPVIILSNLGQRDDVEKGISLGAADFLIKAHFTPGEIVEKIKSILGKKV